MRWWWRGTRARARYMLSSVEPKSREVHDILRRFRSERESSTRGVGVERRPMFHSRARRGVRQGARAPIPNRENLNLREYLHFHSTAQKWLNDKFIAFSVRRKM